MSDDAGILWMEITPEGEAESQFWMPDDEADRARLDAFWQACQEVDWDGVQIHEIPRPQIGTHKITMPIPAPPPPPREGPPPELTEHGLIRRVSHEPAPVAESWRRIEAWIVEALPRGHRLAPARGLGAVHRTVREGDRPAPPRGCEGILSDP